MARLPSDDFMKGIFGGKGLPWALRRIENQIREENYPLPSPRYVDDEDDVDGCGDEDTYEEGRD